MESNLSRVVLTRENAEKFIHYATGIVHTVNPFDYEGEERERLKKFYLSMVQRTWSGPGDIFGWHDNPENTTIRWAEDGTYSELIKALTYTRDTYFIGVYTFIELEDSDIVFSSETDDLPLDFD